MKIDRESVQKRVWVSKWVVMSSQESRDPSSSGNCCFSSGEEFSLTKNKQNEVGGAMPSSSKRNRNKKRMRSTSLGVAKAGNLKLDFMAKSIGITFFGFANIFKCYRDTKT